MSYIGKPPAEHFTSFATQTFSTSATTSYTLDHAVTNENELALFVNNVRQQPGSGKAYTATGTALTLSAATATTDTMYCIFLGRALQTVTPSTNSITSDMLAPTLISGETALTAPPATTDEFLVSDAGTLKRIDFSLMGNAPAWRATMSTAQTGLTNNTAALAAFDTEVYDTDGAYTNTSTNYKFTVPSGQAGKYFIGANINIGEEGDNADLQQKRCIIYKNGSQVAESRDQFSSAVIQGSTNNFINSYTVQNLSAGDYVQVYGQAYNSNFDLQTSLAEFYGFKLIGV
jgi:hypothetical protein